MIGLSSVTVDTAGSIVVTQTGMGTKYRDLSRRVTRTSTLDGGCAIYDNGFSDSDRDISVNIANASKTIVDFIERLIRLYSRIVMTTDDGAFSVAPTGMIQDGRGGILLSAKIVSKLSS